MSSEMSQTENRDGPQEILRTEEVMVACCLWFWTRVCQQLTTLRKSLPLSEP